MKQIELKVIVNEDGTPLDYRQTILAIARNHPQGITVVQMEKAVRVIAATKKADGALKLEDADWEVLKGYVEVFPFAIADSTIIQFKKDIDNAPDIEVK